jgi:DNA-binding response OmpR family regulator
VKSRILIVDDEEDLRSLIAVALTRDGHSVTQAANGVEALLALKRELPDLMILDLRMPEMDGYAVLAKVRAEPAFRGLTVLILSGQHQPEDLEKGLELGADEYLFKPIENWELKARVKSLLRQHALRQRVAAFEGSQAASTARELQRFLEDELTAARDPDRRAHLEALVTRTRALVELFEKNVQLS